MRYLFLIFLMAVTGCEQKPQVRHYTEVVMEAPAAPVSDPHVGMDMGQDPHVGLDMGKDPHAGLDMSAAMGTSGTVAWNAPQGWAEEAGQGLRLATFHDAANPKDIDVSIVPLGGSISGGVESNLKRWLGQINVQVPDAQLRSFIQSSPDNVFDFTQLQKGQDPSVKSMAVAIVPLQEMTVFVKMAGSIEAVSRNKGKFMDLVRSVHSKPGAAPAPSEGAMPAAMLPTANSAVQGKLAWQAPAGWQEQPASGMRMATFRLASDPQKIDCYILSLGGMAGGLEANLSRWMGQIGLDASAEHVQQLISSSQSLKTQDGQDIKVYDFTAIQKGAPASDKSMMAAVLSTAGATVFVKMTGTIEAVGQNRDSFLELVKSIRHP